MKLIRHLSFPLHSFLPPGTEVSTRTVRRKGWKGEAKRKRVKGEENNGSEIKREKGRDDEIKSMSRKVGGGRGGEG